MKNQYFGDVNDYLKYGLLRALMAGSAESLLVAWALTPDDGRKDGGRRSYLERPEIWARYDPPLFESLVGMDILRPEAQLSVSLIEESGLLPRTSYYREEVPDTREERDAWKAGLLSAAKDVDIVFLDPDNGIEVPSKPVGRKDSSKYVTWDEIRELWNAGKSILIFQHFPREKRIPFIQRMAQELSVCMTGAGFVEAFRTSHVLYLLASQVSHARNFKKNVGLIKDRWKGRIEVVGLS
ncbi:MAG: hypothetical protein K9K66_06705 [Desulfarculaceae bacterium]|nr:hypothetical protein [Desulfarculaceae bacterium]MCF8071779.1 hypothetical protein [Desulfarculaceae bacterium]MCF8101329.1 hypothetical protein [Desulfarculaceae bacterium]MCF8117288.1 hypothetical protein [Desulfarculaceae bacterium]